MAKNRPVSSPKMMPSGLSFHMDGSMAPETRITPSEVSTMDKILMRLNSSLNTRRLRIAVMAGELKASTVATAAPLYCTENVQAVLKMARVRP